MILVIGFVLRRAALVLGFDLAEGGVPMPLFVGYAVQLAAGLLAGLLVAIEHRWVLPALLVLGASIAVTLGLDLALLSEPPRPFDLASGVGALLATGALYLGLRRTMEGDDDGDGGTATPDGRPPR